MRTYGRYETKEDETRCITGVYSGLWGHSKQCPRKRGHGEGGLYCEQHDPEKVVERDAAQQKEMEKAYKKRNDKYERDMLLAKMAEGISLEDLKKCKIVREAD